MPASYRRYLLRRGYLITAWNCRAAGDEAGFALNMRLADEVQTKSLAEGPPVSLADRRRDPPASSD
jgi:hypothetical protein